MVLPLCSLEDGLVLALAFWARANLYEKQHKLNAGLRTILSICSLCYVYTGPLTSDFPDPSKYIYSVMCS